MLSWCMGAGASPFRLLRDCINFDAELERAVAFACGSIVVSDSLELAKTLRYGWARCLQLPQYDACTRRAHLRLCMVRGAGTPVMCA
ncbi:hypothetical protein EON66_09505 [archaeon]|nr:MAG: hypothetical protein EON66_09505 [archaeon]